MISLIVGAISLSTVFLFGCIGEILTEKSGHLNLGIPGIMCAGTAGGCFAASLYMSKSSNPTWFMIMFLSIISSFIFAAIIGAIYAFLTVTLRCNQNITGLAITTFGSGFVQFFIDNIINYSKNMESFYQGSKLISKSLPFASKLGVLGDIFLSHGFLTYFAIVLAILMSLFLKNTKKGLNLRSIGENPATADAAGINVTAYKYFAILVGSGIAGIGGFFYIMDYIGGSWENSSTIVALGWLSIALVIFTIWRPNISILGSIIFALFYIIPFKITGVSFTQMSLLKLLPYVITIVVLIATSLIGFKGIQPPSALGKNYFREER